MLYAAFLSFKAGLDPEAQRGALARRATYQFPAGVNWKAEYWPSGPTQVVCIFEADGYEPVFRLVLDWQDVFDINVYPTTTAEEGLQIGARIMGG
jgi:hypothetical protein